VGEGKIFKVVSHIGNEQLLVLTKEVEKQNVLFFGFLERKGEVVCNYLQRTYDPVFILRESNVLYLCENLGEVRHFFDFKFLGA